MTAALPSLPASASTALGPFPPDPPPLSTGSISTSDSLGAIASWCCFAWRMCCCSWAVWTVLATGGSPAAKIRAASFAPVECKGKRKRPSEKGVFNLQEGAQRQRSKRPALHLWSARVNARDCPSKVSFNSLLEKVPGIIVGSGSAACFFPF